MHAFLLASLDADDVDHLWAAGADAVVLDLARAAGPLAGRQARLEAAASRRPPAGPALHVAISPVDAPGSIGELEAAMAVRPEAIWLIGARSGRDATCLAARLSVAEARLGRTDGQTRIVALAGGSAAEILDLASFVGSTARLLALAHDPAALAADLAAEEPEDALAVSRGLFLLAARAAGVMAVDAAAAAGPIPAAAASLAGRRGFAAMLLRRAGDVAVLRAATSR